MSRKESTCPLASDAATDTPTRRTTDVAIHHSSGVYPFAVVLRLRVLQIVCGISAVVMGTVALIEEQGEMNLGLGVPAGLATVIAAAVSIHTSRGFGGYHASTCSSSSPLRFLGPSAQIALPLGLLWGLSCALQVLLLVQCVRTYTYSLPSASSTVRILAGVEASLAGIIFVAAMFILKIDCKYDPDCPGVGHDQLSSGTGLSLVQVPSTSSERNSKAPINI